MSVKRFSRYSPFEGDSIKVEAKVPIGRIADLCRRFDLYEGIAYIRTRDPSRGIVEFWVSPSFMDDFHLIFSELQKEIPVELLQKETN